jgi:hypothetical protein
VKFLHNILRRLQPAKRISNDDKVCLAGFQRSTMRQCVKCPAAVFQTKCVDVLVTDLAQCRVWFDKVHCVSALCKIKANLSRPCPDIGNARTGLQGKRLVYRIQRRRIIGAHAFVIGGIPAEYLYSVDHCCKSLSGLKETTGFYSSSLRLTKR